MPQSGQRFSYLAAENVYLQASQVKIFSVTLSNFTNLHPAIVPLMNANDCYSIFKYGLKCFISTCTFVPGAELAGGFPSFIASSRSAFAIAKSMKSGTCLSFPLNTLPVQCSLTIQIILASNRFYEYLTEKN